MKRKNTSSDMDISDLEVVSIDELLKIEIESLKKEIESLKKENLKLKVPKVEKIAVTDEIVIAEIQLRILKNKAMEGELTLEEIKKYDLLVKNKKLAEGNATVITDYKRLPEGTSEQDLIAFASIPLDMSEE